MKVKITLLVESNEIENIKSFVDKPQLLKEELNEYYFIYGEDAIIDIKTEQVPEDYKL